MEKLEVHALHYLPRVRMAPVGDMGFLSRLQNHVAENVRVMSSTNQTLTGQTGKVAQAYQQETTIPARRMCNDF